MPTSPTKSGGGPQHSHRRPMRARLTRLESRRCLLPGFAAIASANIVLLFYLVERTSVRVPVYDMMRWLCYYAGRVARRMSWTTFSAGSLDDRVCCLIFAPVNVTMSQKLSLLQSANSVSRALTADRRWGEYFHRFKFPKPRISITCTRPTLLGIQSYKHLAPIKDACNIHANMNT
jgi:hypothetical protein